MYVREMTVSLPATYHRTSNGPKRLMTTEESIKQTMKKNGESMIFIGMIIGIVLVGLISFAFLRWMQSDYEEKISELEGTNGYLNNRIDRMTTEHRSEMDNQQRIYQSQLDAVNAELQSYQEELANINEQLEEQSTITISMIRKYKYMVDYVDTSKGFTWDMLMYLDSQCKEYDLNPHMVTAIFKKESEFDVDIQNPRSSARGLGQTLQSTAKTVYETMLGNGAGSYSHAMADNGYTNIAIVCCYLKYLKDNYNGPNAMVNAYSGDGSNGYYNAWVKIMKNFGNDPTINRYI